MPEEYTKEQLWKLYEKLPDILKEAILSTDNADHIYDICTRNGIEDNRMSDIAHYTGHVLMGLLSPEDFQTTLERELNLEVEVAKRIAHEINRYIFFPVKESLAVLYKVGVILPEVAPSEVGPAKEEKPRGPDIYREPIE